MLLIIRGNVYKKVYNGAVMNNIMNKMLAVYSSENEVLLAKIALWIAAMFLACISLEKPAHN